MKSTKPFSLALFATAIAGLLVGPLAATPVRAQEAATAKQTDLPGAKEVFQKHLDATGDAEAIAAIENIVMTGSVQIPAAGITGKVKIIQVQPDKISTVMELPQVGKQTQVFDGETGWISSGVMGVQKMSDDQIAQTKAQLAVQTMEGFRDTFKKARIVGKTEFDGSDTYEMNVVTKADQEMSMFFDVESGLMTGMKIVSDTPMGKIPMEVCIRDYQTEGPMKMSRKTVIKVGPQEIVMTIDDVKVDTDIPAETFERPEELK